MRVWLWLVYKFTKNYCHLRLFSEFIETHWQIYLSWQNSYPKLSTCHIKLKFFLWTRLLESLLLAKYLISVAATLIRMKNQIFFSVHDNNLTKKLLAWNAYFWHNWDDAWEMWRLCWKQKKHSWHKKCVHQLNSSFFNSSSSRNISSRC